MSSTPIFDETDQDYFVALDGSDLVVVGREGFILASSNSGKIGQFCSAKKIKGKVQNNNNLHFHHGPNGITISEQKDNKELAKMLKILVQIFIDDYIEHKKSVSDSTDKFVKTLINEKNLTPDIEKKFESRAIEIGYDINVERIAILMRFNGFFSSYLPSVSKVNSHRFNIIDEWKRKIDLACADFFTKNFDVITAYLGKDTFLVFKDRGDFEEKKFVSLLKSNCAEILKPLKNQHIESIEVGIGNGHSGIRGLSESYNEAYFALHVGKLLYPHNNILSFSDLGSIFILADGNLDKKTKFANNLLSKLKNHDLLDTLEAFFQQNLNVSDTADKLKIHRNTVIYRLDRLGDILGMDPRIFYNAVNIRVAMILKRLSDKKSEKYQ